MTDSAQATATVTITLDDDEHRTLLDALVSHIDRLAQTRREYEPAMRLYQRIGGLESAPPPAPSDAHPVFRDFQIVENAAIPPGMIISVAEDDIVVSYGDRVMMIAKTDLGAALAAGRSAGEGTSDE